MDELVLEAKKRHKTGGIILFAMACGLVVLRVSVYLLSIIVQKHGSEFFQEIVLDLFFSSLMQVGVNFVMIFFIVKYFSKNSSKEIFAESNFKKTVWWFYPLSLLAGISAYFFTMGASSAWGVVISIFGYRYPAGDVYPETFSVGYLLLTLFLSAVLPGFCEEHAMRGYVLTSLRHNYDLKKVCILSALIFGLAHQYITQVFYAAIFGAFLAYLTVKTGSIYPAMIIHFTNNTMANLMGFADNYGWGNNIVGRFENALIDMGILYIPLLVILGGALVFLFTYPIFNKCAKDKLGVKIDPVYRPSAKDSAFHYGALAITVAATVFTFAFNWY